MSSLTLATFFFLRHLPDASGRGIGKPLRTTNRSRLVFRYTSNILKAPQPDRQNIAGSIRAAIIPQRNPPAAMDRQTATDCSGWRGGHNGGDDTAKVSPQVAATSALRPEDGVIGRPSLWIVEDFWVLRFRLMVKRGPW